MKKPLANKIGEQLEGGAKSVKDKLEGIRSQPKRSVAKVTGLAVGAAGIAVAGVAAAVHLARNGDRGAARFEVASNGSEGWVIRANGSESPVERFRTKRSAVRAARKMAADAAPSDLIIRAMDGSVVASHQYDSG